MAPVKRSPPWLLVTVRAGRGEVAHTTELYQGCERPAATGVLHLPGRSAIYVRLLVGEGEYGDSD